MDLELSVLVGLLCGACSYLVELPSGLTPLRVLVLVSLSQLLILKLYRVFIYPHWVSPIRHLPGPTDGHFFFGQMIKQLLTPGPIDIYLDWMRQWPEEPLIRYLSVANTETILLNSPAALREMQQTKAYSFCKPGIAARMFSPITGIGLMFSEGDVHKRLRNKLSRPFSPNNVKRMLPVFQGKARELCRVMEQDMNADANKIVDVEPWFHKAALDILAIASIGYDLKSLSTPVASFYETYDRIIRPPRLGHIITFIDGHVPLRSWLPLPSNRQWHRDNKFIREMLLEKLRLQRVAMQGEKKEGSAAPSGGRDLLRFILEDSQILPNEACWEDKELLEVILNFVAGGHETVGNAFMWAAYALATFPDAQAKLFAEIASLYVGQPSDWEPDFADIEALPYLNNFVRELLRVYSPALFLPRQAAEDVSICGTFVPKGTHIIISPSVAHYNPTIWGADAERFNPDRWDERQGTGAADNHYAFAPFLHGPKGCIARPFAMLCLKVVIMEMARAFSFAPKGEDVGRELEFANPNFTLRPKEALRIVVQKRGV
ncbi:cytochrome P450 3A13 [Plectosphaerella cucumerina]|uniref:Cytochrome P450 3A13 n=1 Tax=Plectosphaerella cucumerina TaxID=40658 RepID=A0A8K0X7F3_9PEZI|nr:cytochrome P450 3A13 [Plectosphaerella cucumerina]